MICEICGEYWTPPVGWYLNHPRTEQVCAKCLEKRKEANETSQRKP